MTTETPETLSPFWDHVDALRETLIKILIVIAIGSAASFYFYRELFTLLTTPLNSIAPEQLVVLGPIDGIMATVKTCFWTGLAATSPVWLTFFFRFLSPALHQHERQLVIPFSLLSLLCLPAGFFFAYFLTIPLANGYLQAFNSSIGQNLWTLSSYLDYTAVLLLGNAVAFEAFAFLMLLVHGRVLSPEGMKAKRKHVVIGAFFAGAVLTPPDILTQAMMAVPLILLYEVAILYGKWRFRAAI